MQTKKRRLATFLNLVAPKPAAGPKEAKSPAIIPRRNWAALDFVPPAVLPGEPQPPPIIIPGRGHENGRLSDLILVGRTYHPLCRQAFVEKVQIGYYAYERREEWRTCTLAAAYAGAFGPDSIQRPDFSYTMAVWRLSQRLGYDIGKLQVVGPTGRHNSLANEMIELTDVNLWTRAGVAEWVSSIGM